MVGNCDLLRDKGRSLTSLFGEFHRGLQNAFAPTVPTHDAGEANRSEAPPAP